MVWAAEFVRAMAPENLRKHESGVAPTAEGRAAMAVMAANRATLIVAMLREVASSPGLSRDTPEAMADMLGVRT